MTFDEVWLEVLKIYEVCAEERPFYSSQLTGAHIDAWSASTGISKASLYDQIAVRVAHGYHEREFDFTFCDAVVNHLSALVTDTYPPPPEVFWDIYFAFDEGEYYHNESRDEEPEEIYTRPQIEKIIKALI